MRVDDDFFDHRIADVHEVALEFVGEFLFPVRTDDERGTAKVHFADLILEVETVRGELDFCFDVVIQRVCFLRDFFAECFRRVVRNEQLLWKRPMSFTRNLVTAITYWASLTTVKRLLTIRLSRIVSA